MAQHVGSIARKGLAAIAVLLAAFALVIAFGPAQAQAEDKIIKSVNIKNLTAPAPGVPGSPITTFELECNPPEAQVIVSSYWGYGLGYGDNHVITTEPGKKYFAYFSFKPGDGWKLSSDFGRTTISVDNVPISWSLMKDDGTIWNCTNSGGVWHFMTTERFEVGGTDIGGGDEGDNNSEPAATPGWKGSDSTGWQYQNSDGSYVKDAIVTIEGKKYYFNAEGYMQTGWVKVAGKYYCFASSGAMETGWIQSGGNWYYLDPADNGAMVEGWKTINGVTYYMATGGSGAMVTGWAKINDVYHYFAGSGALETGWVQSGGTWYYLDPSNNGAMVEGWKTINDVTYYMATGGSGAMVTGWKLIDGKYYYFEGSGQMAENCWVGNYYLGSDGVMLTNTTTPDGFHVGADGAWDGKPAEK